MAAGDPADVKICCCMHDHSQDCLWLQFKQEHGSDAAHKLHETPCNCYKEKLKGIDHVFDCKVFRQFYQALAKGQ